MSRRSTAAVTLLGAIACSLAACGGEKDGLTPPQDNTPASVTITPPPSTSLTSGSSLSLAATVKTRDGRDVTSGVTWSSSDPTVVAISGNTATAAKAGSATITASAGTVTSGGLLITVLPGAPARLLLKTQPTDAYVGVALASQPALEVQDAAGNLVTNAAVTVTVALSGAGTLGGSTSVTTTGGVARFSDLVVIADPGARALSFSAPGLPSVTSSSFTVTGARLVAEPSAVSITTPSGSDPTPSALLVSTGNVVAAGGLAVDTVVYDAGQPTGWLAVGVGSAGAPAVLSLNVTARALAAGTYRATVRVRGVALVGGTPSSVAATPTSFTVSLTVVPRLGAVSYGTTQKVFVLDPGQTVSPPVAVSDSLGAPVASAPVTFTTRGASVATVSSTGQITAKAAGQTWVAVQAPGGVPADSVYVIVTRSAAGPVLRAELATYAYRSADTTVFNLVLDTRKATVGAATITFSATTVTSWFRLLSFSAPTTGVVPVLYSGTSGTVQISIVSASGVSGVIPLLQVRMAGRSPGLSGYLLLTANQILAPDGTDLSAQTTSTQYPVIIR